MTASQILWYCCLAMVAGVVLQSLVIVTQAIVWVFLLAGLLCFAIPFVWSNTYPWKIIAFLVFCLVLGILRMQIVQYDAANDYLAKIANTPEKMTLTGQIVKEPEVRDTSQKLTINVKNSLVLVTVGRWPEYRYLDTITLTGKLKTPAVFDTFDYRSYLAKDGIHTVMDFPKVEKVRATTSRNPVKFLYQHLIWLKGKLKESIGRHFAPPESFVMQGIVFGSDEGMSQDLKDRFTVTGLSHLTAVSGSNIVIVIAMVLELLLALGLWRQQALAVALFFIWGYVALIGFPVSAIRAAIMGSVLLASQIFGRQNTSMRVLVITGAVMLWQNPLLLRYDVSFQLSFLASLGIIQVKPIIDAVLTLITREKFKFITDNISVTLAAQLLTLPIIIYNFGRLSLVAPLTNILVLPMIPALTVLGLLVSIGGSISVILGFILSLPCRVLLFYFLQVVNLFYQSWAAKNIESISWPWIFPYYVAVMVMVWYWQRKQKPRWLGF